MHAFRDSVDKIKETGDSLVLTINGKAELVVQDAAAYQRLRQFAEEARVLEGIRQGIEDMNAGRTISLDQFKEHTHQAWDQGVTCRLRVAARAVADAEAGRRRLPKLDLRFLLCPSAPSVDKRISAGGTPQSARTDRVGRAALPGCNGRW
jgi:PHD/YefM family antitoxin component YafN of YafNO toxin-antitoxin module